VPCFWADAPSPFAATLTFRVGRADETLTTAGITHLAEHILMPASPPRELERNARVENTFASFWAAGNPTRVLRFLEGTAGLIADPPLGRLETERAILRTEAAGAGTHPIATSMALRYGARAHGLVGFDEIGVYELGADAVAEWIARFFTRGNAALWLTGKPPREFEFALPPGDLIPPPPAEAMPEVEFPAVHPAGPDGMIVAAFDATRGAALAMACEAIVERAWQTIRYDRGLAYDIGELLESLTREVMHETLWVASLEENVDAVRDTLLGIFDDVAENGATEQELEESMDRLRDELVEPAQLTTFLHLVATELLLGDEASEQKYVQRREQVTPQDTAEALGPALERMLLAVPSEAQAPDGMRPYPIESSVSVEGRRHRPFALLTSKALRRTSLIVGPKGVTMTAGDGAVYTVLFDELAAAVHWRDGSRALWGTDGTVLTIEPEMWRKGKAAVSEIDAKVPADLVVRAQPEEIARADHVEKVASSKLKRRWVIEDELRHLPDALREGEVVLTLAEAGRGLRAGLLAATDQRLLWLYTFRRERRLEIAYDDIESVLAESKRFETFVKIKTTDEEFSFTDIAPKVRAAEIEAIVNERLASRTSPEFE
jgi:zinc protease